MAKVTMTLTGMEGLQRALKAAPDLVQLGSVDAVGKTAFAISARARATVPFVTGRLKNAISASPGRKTATGASGGLRIDAAAYYWRFVEFGTRYRKAHPYIQPATEAESGDYVDRIRRVGQQLERDLSVSSLA